MSYILEALKKSSEERSRLVCVAASDGPAVSGASHATRQPARWPVAVIGVGALAVIAFFGIGAVQHNETPTSPATVAKTGDLAGISDAAATADVAKNPERTDAAPATAKVKSRPAPDPAPLSPPSAPPADVVPPPKKVAAKPAPPPPEAPAASGSAPPAAADSRNEMPPALLQQVLAIPISAHIYSSKPAERMVIIDGRAVREGDALPSGALVEQITPDGISVSLQGYRAKRPVQ
jgi:general secretion pathway protein B